MTVDAFFQACQDGNVEALHQVFEQDASFDVNVKDVHSMTGLAYAARNGQVDLVRELLNRGAEKAEVVEQGYGLNNGEIASLFGISSNDQTAEGSGQNGYHVPEGIPIDIHGGQQMPDGTVSYVNAEQYGQAYPLPPHFDPSAAPYGHHYYPDGSMHALAPQHLPPSFQPSNGSGNGRRSANGNHTRKESANANLPPPEIARMIPCKYFPNCKYGDKCVFAHPIAMSGPPLPPMQGHPPMSPPAPHQMQPPMFYQQLPPGYPYPAFAAGPQQFINATPIGHPLQSPYGAPLPFGQAMMQAPEVQQQQEQSQQATNSTAAEEQGASGNTAEAEAKPSEEVDASSSTPAVNGTGNEAQQTSGTESEETAAQPAKPDVEAPTKTDASQPAPKNVHRRQSFNSFLHHHAIPFQPQGIAMAVAAAAAEGSSLLSSGPATGSRGAQGGKGSARRNGNQSMSGHVNGFMGGKRGNHSGERPACMFFQSGRCKYGDECRFPHLLVDGTDARPMQAQQRQMYAAQFEALNGGEGSAFANGNSPSLRTAAVDGAANGNSNAPASAPTGPQADKRAQQQAQQQQQSESQQTGEQSQQQKQTSQAQEQAGQASEKPSKSNGSSKNASNGNKAGNHNNSNGIVRSQPSKTSTQNNANGGARSASNGSGNQNKKNQAQRQQKQQQPQQPQQRIPTTSDFPALSPNLNANSSAASPLPTPPAINGAGPLALATDAEATRPAAATPSAPAPTAVTPTSTSSAPKVNFSAVLSAPAPVKPKAPETTSTAAATNNEKNSGDAEKQAATSNGAPSEDDAEEKAAASPAPVKTHAAAAAAGATTTNGIVSMTKTVSAQTKQVNGVAKEKPARNGHANANGASANGSAKDAKAAASTQAPNSYKAAAAAAPKVNGVAEDDDFQLVNRSRTSSKRPSQPNGSSKRSDGYTHQAKAVVA